MRDAKASEGVDAIGEISQEAKRKVLSHEAKIGKRELANLAGAPKEEIAEVAQSIEDGTYEKGAQPVIADTDESTINDTSQETGISKPEDGRLISDTLFEALSNDLSAMLRTLKTGTATQAKHAVGKCAEMLESLHAVL